MGFVCPEHGHRVRLSDRVCPECGCPLTVGALLASMWRKIRERIFRPVRILCPRCHQPSASSGSTCDFCGASLTVGAAVETTVAPAQRQWREFRKKLSPADKRRIQWIYCLLSAALLWWTLGYVEKYHSKLWALHATLSVVFLTAFIFVFMAGWVLPRETVKTFARRAPGPTKLAICSNYLTLVLLLQVAVGTWWTRATILAGMFAVSWGAAALLLALYPHYQRFFDVFLREENPNRPVDASEPQGRSGLHD